MAEPDESEKDAFYVVRKGDVIGIYRTLKECQAQVWDPTFTVYKGHSLTKEAEEYLSSNGLKNASYAINSSNVPEDIFGSITPCSRQPGAFASSCDPHQASRIHQTLASGGASASSCDPTQASRKYQKLTSGGASASSCDPTQASRKYQKLTSGEPSISYAASAQDSGNFQKSTDLNAAAFCLIEFDGASKGNPGKAGAGAVVRAEDGQVICRLREGLGVATNNFAEYRAVILGMKYALRKGYKHIEIQGDSKLVVMQMQNLYQTKSKNIVDLSNEAKKLKDKFASCQIKHVLRELNKDADIQANLAAELANGEVQEEHGDKPSTGYAFRMY